MKNKDRSLLPGFTLVELLVVIVMVAVLVTIAITMVFRFRKSGDKTVATNNLRQIQAANIGYAADNNGRFVPPSGMVGGITYQWFVNPDFISQIKGVAATYKSGGIIDTDLDISLMDPAVVREKPAGYKSLDSSYGYTTPSTGEAFRQSHLNDPARSAAFITASAAYADFGAKSVIAYRHVDKAIVAYYDGHASPITLSEIAGKAETDIFWTPSEVPPAP